MNLRKRFITVAVVAAAALGTAGVSLAAPVPFNQASPYFTLYHNGDSTARWNARGEVVLTAGTDAGTSAQVLVNELPANSQAPLTAPSFTPSTSGGGDPRWVIEFHNGCYLFGFPNETGFTTANDWSVNPGGAQGVSYATARADALACGLDNWVTAAFIVDDAGFPGTPVTLTKISYAGHSIAGH